MDTHYLGIVDAPCTVNTPLASAVDPPLASRVGTPWVSTEILPCIPMWGCRYSPTSVELYIPVISGLHWTGLEFVISTALQCTALKCTVHSTALNYICLHCTVLHNTALHSVQCTVMYCTEHNCWHLIDPGPLNQALLGDHGVSSLCSTGRTVYFTPFI